MKGFIVRRLVVGGLLGSAVASTGCYTSWSWRARELYDPCYPERYNAVARDEVVAVFGPQVQNGHILDQTVWNYHFVAGSDELHPGGMDKLKQLIHRRPCPDPTVYLATAQDLNYSATAPEDFVQKRADLDARRVEAVQKYLNAQTAGRNVTWQVVVHDPAEVGLHATPMNRSIGLMQNNFQGVLPGTIMTGGVISGIGGGQ